MDHTAVAASEILQQKLRDKKAQASRQVKQDEQTTNNDIPRRPGRDDNIFADDDVPKFKRSMGNREFKSSPAGPARPSKQNGRTSNFSASTNSTSRAMGVREAQEHVDKLAKQNFDLKLEVYHRREKCAQLEKKIEALSQLEDDNAELWDVNREAIAELDKRDRAIDEAVVMICDLEAKVQSLEEEIENSRPSTAYQAQFTRNAHNSSNSRSRQDAFDRQSKDQSSAIQQKVDTDATLRASEIRLSSPRESRLPVPSFIDHDSTATNALRSMYMDGDKMIRPIPSYASLLSGADVRESEMYYVDAFRSPRSSDLSDLDALSLSGRPQSGVTVHSCAVEEDASQSPSRERLHSQDGRASRTNKWVARSAVSPSRNPKVSRSMSAGGESFQSLGDVLHQDSRGVEATSPSLANLRIPNMVQEKKEGLPPSIPINPMFGQHAYPPTPDTMLTRPSTHSSSSVIQDKSMLDSTPAPPQGYASLLPNIDMQLRSINQGRFGVRNSLLPPELDSPEQPTKSTRERKMNYESNFGASLFQHEGYTSDDSMTYTPRGPGRPVQSPSREIAYDPISTFELSPPRRYKLASRPHHDRRHSVENLSATASPPSSPPTSHYSPRQNQRPAPMIRTSSASAAPTQHTFTPTEPMHSNAIVTSHSARPRPSDSLQTSDSGIPLYRRVRITASRPETPQAAIVQPAESVSTGRISRQSATLRQRVARLARRNSATSSPNAESTVTPAPHGRSNSITRRLFQRRGSSSTSQPSSTVSPRKDLREEASSSRAAAFLSAATAAAPFLDSSTSSSRGGAPSEITQPASSSKESGSGVSVRSSAFRSAQSSISAASNNGSRGPGMGVDALGDGPRSPTTFRSK